jgi:hypothetical protein
LITSSYFVGASTGRSAGDLIITLAARYKLPAVYDNRFYVAAGGLIQGWQTLDVTRLRLSLHRRRVWREVADIEHRYCGRYTIPSIASTVRSTANASTTDAPLAASSSFVAT